MQSTRTLQAWIIRSRSPEHPDRIAANSDDVALAARFAGRLAEFPSGYVLAASRLGCGISRQSSFNYLAKQNGVSPTDRLASDLKQSAEYESFQSV